MHFVRVVRLGAPKDKSEPSGSVKEGVVYANTRAMMPDQKESAYLHIPSYATGMLFHIGAFCCLLFFVLVVALLSGKALYPMIRNMETQKQFITNAGHELKTPLAIIQANTEAMELIAGESKWSRNIKTQTARLTGKTQVKISREEKKIFAELRGRLA